MKNLSIKIWIAAIFIFVLAGCAPAKNPASQSTDAINQIRKLMQIPESPLKFVENVNMANSPSGGLEVANYQDGEGRIYSVDPKTNQVVEIDARATLSKISASAPALSQAEIKAKAQAYAKAIIPNFDSLQSSLVYEQGGKIDNYFFTWRGEVKPGSMNGPFLQFAFHKSGVLFGYINTLSVEK